VVDLVVDLVVNPVVDLVVDRDSILHNLVEGYMLKAEVSGVANQEVEEEEGNE
jgi:hypothetical protein